MANVPGYTTNNISLGPGVLYIGPAGATPSLDVGAIAEDGMEFTVTREYLEVFQGSPRQRIIQFVTDEGYELVVNSIEWNLMNLYYALGAGVTSSSASQDIFSFGGDPATANVAVKVTHTLPTGQTMSFYLWRCQPSGEWQLSMKQNEIQQFPFSFAGLISTMAWDGVTALGSGSQLFRIIRQKT